MTEGRADNLGRFLGYPRDQAELPPLIHSAIYDIASRGTVRVGIVGRDLVSWAIKELRKCSIRKPWFINPHDWLKQIIIEDAEAFDHLAMNIQLEFIVKGKLKFWTGAGSYIDHKTDAQWMLSDHPAADTMRNLMSKRPPLIVTINLGLEYAPFADLLQTPNEDSSDGDEST